MTCEKAVPSRLNKEETSILPPVNHISAPEQTEREGSSYVALAENGPLYEIVDGALYRTPRTHPGWHQRISVRFAHYLYTHVELQGLGEVLQAPFDVELASQTVVQPDLLVILTERSHKCTPARLLGAPDLVIEIVEPSTVAHDRCKKYSAYARSGVREYWVVDATARSIEIYGQEASIYHMIGTFKDDDLLPSKIIPHFPVRVKQFFP